MYWWPLSLIYTYDTSISISTSISTRMFTSVISISLRWQLCKRRSIKIGWAAFWHKIWFQHGRRSFLSLHLCLCLHHPIVHVRHNDASISTSTSTREWNNFHSLVLMLASLRRTCKLGWRKHKHKRKHKGLTCMLASHHNMFKKTKSHAKWLFSQSLECLLK